MSSTLLQLVSTARQEMGLAAPNNVIGSTDTDIIQSLTLINALGNELQRQFPWNALEKEYRFYTSAQSQTGTTTANSTAVTLTGALTLDTTYMVTGTGIPQDTYVSVASSGLSVTLTQQASSSGTNTLTFSKVKYSMPSDYDRMADRTQWDKTRHWEMIGPLTAQQWQYLKSGFISTGPRVRWRILGNTFQIWPTVQNNEYLGFEYLSSYWAADTGGTAKGSFTVDTDTCIYPDRLMILGLKMKYFSIKGFDISAIEQDYMSELSIAKSNDQGAATLSLAPSINTVLVGWNNLPDSGYGT
jgi:hypothetical protein